MALNSKLILPLTVVLLIVVLSISLTLHLNAKGENAENSLREINTPYVVYAPEALSDDLSIDAKSISYSRGVVFYTISSISGNINVSQQRVPEQKIPIELPKTNELQVSAGQAIVSRFGNNRAVVSVTNDQSLITISIPFQISDAKITDLLESFKPTR